MNVASERHAWTGCCELIQLLERGHAEGLRCAFWDVDVPHESTLCWVEGLEGASVRLLPSLAEGCTLPVRLDVSIFLRERNDF